MVFPLTSNLLPLLLPLLLGVLACAQETDPNRGWRWEVGVVNFPTTSNVTDVQVVFNRGVALLHNFWYDEALVHFMAIHTLDPNHAVTPPSPTPPISPNGGSPPLSLSLPAGVPVAK